MDDIKHSVLIMCPIVSNRFPNFIPGMHKGHQVMFDLIEKSSYGYSHTALFLVSLNFTTLNNIKVGFLKISYVDYGNDPFEGPPMYTANIILLDISEGNDVSARKWGVLLL